MAELQTLATDFGLSWPKLIAQIIIFLIVYFILNKFAFGPIIAMLEERRRRIEEAQTNAAKIKQQLADAEVRYQETIRKANAEAQQLLDEARKSGEALSQKQAQEAIREAEGIIAKAQAAIETERNAMIAEVRKEMIGLVTTTTAKVTGKILTKEDQERLNAETTRQLAA